MLSCKHLRKLTISYCNVGDVFLQCDQCTCNEKKMKMGNCQLYKTPQQSQSCFAKKWRKEIRSNTGQHHHHHHTNDKDGPNLSYLLTTVGRAGRNDLANKSKA